jgi:hypothetical protein
MQYLRPVCVGEFWADQAIALWVWTTHSGVFTIGGGYVLRDDQFQEGGEEMYRVHLVTPCSGGYGVD